MLKQSAIRNFVRGTIAVVGWLIFLGPALAEEQYPTLKAGKVTYTNVTVTGVTATDVYFTHAGGMGNAKLRTLDPELQKHFHFDAAKDRQIERDKAAMNEACRQFLIAREQVKEAPKETEPEIQATNDANGDPVMTELFAKAFRGQRPPQIIVDQWLTPPPDVEGKSVLVVIFRSGAKACRRAIPHLNELAERFKDRLVVIGLSDEEPETVAKMGSPKMEYSYGVDTQRRTMSALEVRGLPHAILIDPKHTVRFEGIPTFLDADALGRLLDKYGS